MPCIEGVYRLVRHDIVSVIKRLDASGEVVNNNNEQKQQGQKWFQVIDHGDDSFTIHIGRAWNTFTIDREFEHALLGGVAGVAGKCRSVMRRPSENVLDKLCQLPNGKAYRSVLSFAPKGIEADVTVGDIRAKRFFERVTDITFIPGKYKLLREDATLEESDIELSEDWAFLQISSAGGDAYTMQTERERRTFAIDQEFSYAVPRPRLGTAENCRSVVSRPNMNTLDKLCTLAGGGSYHAVMHFGPGGMMADIAAGEDTRGKKYYVRVE